MEETFNSIKEGLEEAIEMTKQNEIDEAIEQVKNFSTLLEEDGMDSDLLHFDINRVVQAAQKQQEAQAKLALAERALELAVEALKEVGKLTYKVGYVSNGWEYGIATKALKQIEEMRGEDD